MHLLRSARLILSVASFGVALVSPPYAHAREPKGVWLTTPDRRNLLAQKPSLKWKKDTSSQGSVIVVDDSKRYQTMDGFGHTVTGGTAQLLMKMSPVARSAVLHELFDANGKGIDTSYIRISVGASDMNDHVYTYDDMPTGEADPDLKRFSLAEDEKDVIPVLREIVAIQPRIKILASPWTAPSWMKDNDNPKGGTLQTQYYEAYASYLVKYLQGMKEHGIVIDALTPQNEPENPKNTPSMLLTSEQEAQLIGKHLGPDIAKAGLKTRIIDFDHNCDHPNYAIDLLKDPDAAKYTDGSGFHLYLGKITALTEVHNAFPQKNLYFTEQMVVPRRNNTQLLVADPVARLIVGAPENWSRNVLLWNLAADPQNGPHTGNGGCPICTGAVTLDGDNVKRLVAYYVTAHASKFVPPGSVHIDSTSPDTLPHVAFVTPAGRHVLIVSNNTTADSHFTIHSKNKVATVDLLSGAVATYVW